MHKNSPSINERKKNNRFIKSASTSFLKAAGEYSLKQSFFDPTKNSPPNEFMIKLYMRDDLYNIKK